MIGAAFLLSVMGCFQSNGNGEKLLENSSRGKGHRTITTANSDNLPYQESIDDVQISLSRLELLSGNLTILSNSDSLRRVEPPLDELKVFVSSTFTDTHDERNILLAKVEPYLREKARPYGLAVTLVDLRYVYLILPYYNYHQLVILSVVLSIKSFFSYVYVTV